MTSVSGATSWEVVQYPQFVTRREHLSRIFDCTTDQQRRQRMVAQRHRCRSELTQYGSRAVSPGRCWSRAQEGLDSCACCVPEESRAVSPRNLYGRNARGYACCVPRGVLRAVSPMGPRVLCPRWERADGECSVQRDFPTTTAPGPMNAAGALGKLVSHQVRTRAVVKHLVIGDIEPMAAAQRIMLRNHRG